MSSRRVAGLVAAGLIVAASFAAAPVAAKGHLDVLLDGLSSPKGITASGNALFIGQGWVSAPAPVLQYQLSGRGKGTVEEITDPLNLADIAAAADGAGWAIGGDLVLYRQAELGGSVEPILDIAAYQEGDPDPDDQDNFPEESNPNGLSAVPGTGDVLLADAAGNDLIRVSPDGTAVTVARWPLRPLDGMTAEAVPTTVTIGRDGWAYVGELVGFPGTPGSAHIWRVNPNAQDAVCEVDDPNADCAVWKSGFTSIFDIAFNPKNGTLYVYEIAEDGWLAFEEGFATGEFPPAVLVEVKGKKIRELVRGQLSQPGGVTVSNNGKVFVTDGMFSEGRLLQVRN